MTRSQTIAPLRVAASSASPASTLPSHGAEVSDAAPAGSGRRSAAGQVEQEGADTFIDVNDARHLLGRTGFAPDDAQIAPYIGLARGQAVERLLAGSRTEAVTPLPAWVDDVPASRAQRRAWTPDERRAQQQLRRQRYNELRAWWMREMLVTPSALTERMTLFWHNHFATGQDKVPDPQLMAVQNTLLRRDALGSFAALLHGVAKDPAMLLYLDGASNRKGKPNENFAREVMELFTLGEGRYTQQDVTEAARAYTGWSIDPADWRYVWRPDWHDDGEKIVLGQRGAFDGDAVLDILLGEPQTARFVVTKLWREFVSDVPDDAQIEPVAQRFHSSGYDIKVALRGLLLSDAFWDERNRGVLVTSPVEFVVGTVRRFDIDYTDTAQFARKAAALGENLFYPPNVKGWPGGQTWINSATLLARKQFVEQLFRSTGPDVSHPAVPPAGAVSRVSVQSPMAHAAQGGVRFDIDAWLGHYGLTPDARPGLSAQLRMQHAVLPLEPVDAIAADCNASAYLQALLMDPVYQLK